MSAAPRLTEAQLTDPRFDLPATETHTKVFICATPRSGSWLLCRALLHHGIGVPHEYYNPRHFGVLGPRYGVPALRDATRLRADAAVRRAFNAALLARRSPGGVFSAKIHWGEYAAYLDNAEGDALFQAGHFIHLYREDVLGQAISMHIASETGIWGSDATVATPPAKVPSFFNTAAIGEHMRVLAESDLSWRLFFARNAITPLRFSYEQLRDDLPHVVRTIIDRFGLAVPPDTPAYVEDGPDEYRDASVPPRSDIRAAFYRAYRRVKRGDSSGADAQVAERPAALAVAPAPKPAVGLRGRRNKICLCMIVKNEAGVIERCLASVRPLIDYWVIVDTGSTDGTQDVIRAAMADLPGALHERPWVNFAHNRTEALALAKPYGEYSLIMDADDVLVLPPGFRAPTLKDDSITIEVQNKGILFTRPQLLKSVLPWRYEGVLHEFLTCGVDRKGQRMLAQQRSQKRLSGARIIMNYDGARRSLSIEEYSRQDAAVLQNALVTETDPFLIARYTFYLGQAYFDAGELEAALKTFIARAELGGWNDEVFVSLCRAAKLKADLGHDADDVIATFLKAHGSVPNRAEALYGAARFCRIKKRFQQGYDFAKRGLRIKRPGDVLFSEGWVYEYGLLDEYAVNAYWIGQYRECLDACKTLLGVEATPAYERDRIQANADAARAKLADLKAGAGSIS
jgi:LPS sulfotransferase NodH/glycosyltransferase involved in cell wall biosynthesis